MPFCGLLSQAFHSIFQCGFFFFPNSLAQLKSGKETNWMRFGFAKNHSKGAGDHLGW